MNTRLDLIQLTRAQSLREQLKALGWVLSLVALLALVKILVGSCC